MSVIFMKNIVYYNYTKKVIYFIATIGRIAVENVYYNNSNCNIWLKDNAAKDYCKYCSSPCDKYDEINEKITVLVKKS